jgi:hypothetical protein
MTKYTRRSFVKRTGSATLGAALGLGLLPSLTRKLHAADTSVSQGVYGKWKKNPNNDSKEGTVKVLTPVPDTASQPAETLVHTLANGAGTVTTGIQRSMAPYKDCCNSVTVTDILSINVTAVVAGQQRVYNKSWNRRNVYLCENGTPTPTEVDGTPSKIYFPEGSNATNSLVEVDICTSPLKAVVTPRGVPPKEVTWPTPAAMPDIDCCALS